MRSFFARTLSSLILVAFFCWMLSSTTRLAMWGFIALSIVAALLLVEEFHLLFRSELKNLYLPRILSKITGAASAAVFSVACMRGLRAESALALVICLLLLSFTAHLLSMKKDMERLRALVFSYLPLLLFLIPLLHLAPIYADDRASGTKSALFLVLVTKSGDVGAYVFGMLSSRLMPNGNHKMTPLISPNKSWEGFVGGAIASLLVAYLCRDFLPKTLEGGAIVLGIIFYIGAVAGDLLESSFKRIADVKDSGGILPGIGGMLDLSDSLVLNTPVFCYMLYL